MAPTFAPSARSRRGSGPQPFDFRRPNTFNREYARTLQVVNETFARHFATVLTTTLHGTASVTLTSVEQLTYDEYVRMTPNPAFLTLMSLEPLSGVAIFQLPIRLAMLAVDRLLGGPGAGQQPERPVTEIESVLLTDLVARLLRELSYAYASLTELHPRVEKVESSLQFVQVATASDLVVVVSFDVRLGEESTAASLCLPFAALHPVLDSVTTQTMFADRSGDSRRAAQLVEQRLSSAAVEVAVRFRSVRMTSNEILDLQVGDILPLRHPLTVPLSVRTASRVVAAAMPGSAGKRLACRIVEDPTSPGPLRTPR